MAKAASLPKTGARRGSGSSGGWWQGLLCGALLMLAPPLALLLGTLLAPALIARMLDQGAGRPTALAVTMCNLPASVTPMLTLWRQGHDMATAMAMASDMSVVGLAWAAAGAGWLMAELAPVAIFLALEAGARTRAIRLRTVRARLEQEWGAAPGSGTPAQER